MNIPLRSQPRIEFGDPQSFAFSLHFVNNLDKGFATPEEDLSWGRFQFWVNGHNLCEHIDQHEVWTSVDWYLLPLLEWLAESWDHLLHEQRLPGSNCGRDAWSSLRETRDPVNLMRTGDWNAEAAQVQTDWAARHNLRTARQGGLFPDVVIRRWLDEVEISWGPSPLAGAPAGFGFLQPAGFARLDPIEVASALCFVLDGASEALLASMPGSQRLQELSQKIALLKTPSRVSTRIALLAGLRTTQEDATVAWQRLITFLTEHLRKTEMELKGWFIPESPSALVVCGTAEAAVMFGSASPSFTEKDVFNIATKLLDTESGDGNTKKWILPDKPESLDPIRPPWAEGYRLAAEWHKQAQLPRIDAGCAIDIDGHLASLGVLVSQISLDDPMTSGIAVVPIKGQPHIFINQKHKKCEWPSGRRFVMAHEFCHLLHDRAKGRNLALISGPWAPRDIEKRANAFAAALLMPPVEIRSAWQAVPQEVNFESLLDLSHKYEVSPDAMERHLENCGLLDEDMGEALRAQLSNRADRDGAILPPAHQSKRKPIAKSS
jgi:Zn-dependent peptidase ImmA (M78 family)